MVENLLVVSVFIIAVLIFLALFWHHKFKEQKIRNTELTAKLTKLENLTAKIQKVANLSLQHAQNLDKDLKKKINKTTILQLRNATLKIDSKNSKEKKE